MKLATFTHKGVTRVGIVVNEAIVDVTVENADLPQNMIDVLEGGEPVLAVLRSLEQSGAPSLPLAEVHLEAPVLRPPKFLAIGLNYADHIEETGLERPEFPSFFNKQSTCVIGPHDPIHAPRVSAKLDYEGELGFVIGRRCRHVPRERARDVIAGYLIVNDVTVRDWQARSPTWTLGKSFDTHGPTGPWIVTADEIGDPHALDIETWVNEERRQSTNTRHMIFNCFQQVEVLSTAFTLEPGDIISTGTSSGVGVMMTPRGYVKAGDVVRVTIERIGAIENPVIEEPDDTARL
ncbi:MAG: fumarylacetoacetate hydrolase family protein [Gammaproteobacteria bacterium]|nr:fumarylacetoacetate hydrolase family protein [Gammaproteobacteria bacterium]